MTKGTASCDVVKSIRRRSLTCGALILTIGRCLEASTAAWNVVVIVEEWVIVAGIAKILTIFRVEVVLITTASSVMISTLEI